MVAFVKDVKRDALLIQAGKKDGIGGAAITAVLIGFGGYDIVLPHIKWFSKQSKKYKHQVLELVAELEEEEEE